MWQEILVITIVFLAGLGNLGLTIYVYKKEPGQKINRVFAQMAFCISLWCFTNFLSLLTKSHFWLRSTYATGSLLPLLGVFFVYDLVEKKFNKIIKFVAAFLAVLFFYLSFTPLMVKEVFRFEITGFKGTFGKAFIFWVIYMTILALLFLYVLIRGFLKAKGKRKTQIGYFMLGAGAFVVWAITVSVILPALGVLKWSNIDSPSTLFLTGFTSYAIIKYQLMGIETFLFKVFLYSLITAILSGLVILLIFLASWFFSYLGLGGILLVAVFIAVCMVLIGRAFYKKTKALEETKTTLEVRVRARTKELQELTESLEHKVEERTKELKERINELERIHRLTVDRELKMIELKEKIAKLTKALEEVKKKPIPESEFTS